jgi:hypothetical protein
MQINLKEYFERAKGTGVLATADGGGRVDAAIYAKPHIMDKESVAFIMAERLTHHNLQTNTHAAYLFREEGKPRFLVFFKVDQVLPLVGEGRDPEKD